MTDISGLLKSTMQDENCTSLRAFLILKGASDEQLYQSTNVSTKQISDDEQQHKLGTRNRRR